MADALGCDVEDIKPEVSLIEGLDAESIDFLDMVFRLERAFKIKIPRGKIVENARGELPEAEFEQKGIVTDVGHGAAPQAYLSEVPDGALQVADEGRGHPAPVHAGDVLQARRAGAARRHGCRARAVRRCATAAITSPRSRSSTASPRLSPGTRARARFAIPAEVDAFPPCLMAEAVGQLAAWVAMSHIDFRGRPVAALAERDALSSRREAGLTAGSRGRHRRRATTRPLRTAATPTSTASARSSSIDCLGPMLPLAEFDDPARDGRAFALLCDGGAPAGRFHGVDVPPVARDRGAGRRQARTLDVPASAPFFNDHFPRRPVFPATLLLDAQIELARVRRRSRWRTWRDASPARMTQREGALVHRRRARRLELDADVRERRASARRRSTCRRTRTASRSPPRALVIAQSACA